MEAMHLADVWLVIQGNIQDGVYQVPKRTKRYSLYPNLFAHFEKSTTKILVLQLQMNPRTVAFLVGNKIQFKKRKKANEETSNDWFFLQ